MALAKGAQQPCVQLRLSRVSISAAPVACPVTVR